MFFAGEFMHVFTNGVLMAVLFTGGWQGPWVHSAPLIGLIYLLMKASVWYVLSLLLRNSLPRVRIDQLMAYNWKFLVPLSIANLLVTALLLRIVQEIGLAPDNALNFVDNIPQTLILLAGNIGLAAAVLSLLRNYGRRQRLADEDLFEEPEQEQLHPSAAAAGH
jgi:hypothetical protein